MNANGRLFVYTDSSGIYLGQVYKCSTSGGESSKLKFISADYYDRYIETAYYDPQVIDRVYSKFIRCISRYNTFNLTLAIKDALMEIEHEENNKGDEE